MTDVYVQFRLEDRTKTEYVPFVDVWKDQALLDRNKIPENALIISRYSCMPYYEALESEVAQQGSRLVTSVDDHQFLSEMQWYDCLSDLTPTTWFDLDEVEDTEHGYVVKGRTYSRKFQWTTHMRAKNRQELWEVVDRCERDLLLRNGGLAIREFVPLKTYGTQPNGLPMTEEWRCFFAGTTPVASGFYWSEAEIANEREEIPDEAQQVAQEVADRLNGQLQSDDALLAIDVAQTTAGKWILIEVNNGSMSGLSTIDAQHFYTRLKEVYCE